MRDSTGVRVVRWRRRTTVYRPGQWSPPHREAWLRVVTDRRWYLLCKQPHWGWVLASSGLAGQPFTSPDHVVPQEEWRVKKRAPLVTGAHIIVPPLPAKSLMLNKTPLLREWLSATSYEDGSPRVPSYVTLRNRGATYEITLYDPDQGARLVVAGPEIDHVLMALEQLLGVDEAPWEIDKYLAEQLTKRGVRKKK